MSTFSTWQFWSINLWNFREIFAIYDACRVLWLCVTNNYRHVSNYFLSVVWNWKKFPVFLCWMYTSTLYINLHHSCLRSYFRVISVLTIPVLMQPRKLCQKRTHISEIRVVRQCLPEDNFLLAFTKFFWTYKTI